MQARRGGGRQHIVPNAVLYERILPPLVVGPVRIRKARVADEVGGGLGEDGQVVVGGRVVPLQRPFRMRLHDQDRLALRHVARLALLAADPADGMSAVRIGQRVIWHVEFKLVPEDCGPDGLVGNLGGRFPEPVGGRHPGLLQEGRRLRGRRVHEKGIERPVFSADGIGEHPAVLVVQVRNARLVPHRRLGPAQEMLRQTGDAVGVRPPPLVLLGRLRDGSVGIERPDGTLDLDEPVAQRVRNQGADPTARVFEVVGPVVIHDSVSSSRRRPATNASRLLENRDRNVGRGTVHNVRGGCGPGTRPYDTKFRIHIAIREESLLKKERGAAARARTGR